MKRDIVNTIILGDWLDVARDIDDESVDLIITDVPFGVEFMNSKFFDDSKEYVFSEAGKWLEQMARVLKEGSHCYIYVPVLEIDFWVSTAKKHLNYNNKLVGICYTKNVYLKNNFPFDHQDILFCSKGKAKRLNAADWIKTSKSWLKDKRNPNPKQFTYQYTSFLPRKYKINVKSNKQIKLLHPNQKNIRLIQKLILLSSKRDDVVLDCFCGSGTVPLAALKLGRKFIGVDISEEYCKISNKRIEGFKNIPRIDKFVYNK